MTCPRVNSFDYEDETLAWKMCDRFREYGITSWRVRSVVYWMEDSTD